MISAVLIAFLLKTVEISRSLALAAIVIFSATMVPILIPIAKSAKPGAEATTFATMASLMNLALSASEMPLPSHGRTTRTSGV